MRKTVVVIIGILSIILTTIIIIMVLVGGHEVNKTQDCDCPVTDSRVVTGMDQGGE